MSSSQRILAHETRTQKLTKILTRMILITNATSRCYYEFVSPHTSQNFCQIFRKKLSKFLCHVFPSEKHTDLFSKWFERSSSASLISEILLENLPRSPRQSPTLQRWGSQLGVPRQEPIVLHITSRTN